MTPIDGVLPVAYVAIALASVKSLMHFSSGTRSTGRFAAIDGLRGYLALAVFVSHTAIWYYYLRSGRWELTPSRLFTHLGESSVMLFFMITGFLFFSKLLDGRSRPIDWARLYVSRVLRLLPLYLLAVLIVFVTVAFLSAGQLRVPFSALLWRGVEWLSFSLLGSHDLNGLRDTSVILANVTWSLVYEWIFYAALPLLSLMVGRMPPIPCLLGSAVAVIASTFLQMSPIRFLAFAGGIGAALLVRNDTFCRLARSNAAGVLAVVCLMLDVRYFSTAYAFVPLALLSVSFSLIACGNTLFGILTQPASRFLGDLSYSIYLLHGIVLYTVFRLGLGFERAASLSPTVHCAITLSSTPLLIVIACVAYRLVEQPWMSRTSRATDGLRRIFGVNSRFALRVDKPVPDDSAAQANSTGII